MCQRSCTNTAMSLADSPPAAGPSTSRRVNVPFSRRMSIGRNWIWPSKLE